MLNRLSAAVLAPLKMERKMVANQEWIKEMGKGNGFSGGKGKGMESALWVMQGRPGRGGKLAAASRR